MSTSPPIVSADSDLLCPNCGYNLRGSSSDRCPECGGAIDRTSMGASRIPWTHRNYIGRVRAYVRTVWMVFRRPSDVGREVARPVAYSDAVRFRAITIALLLLMLLAMVVMVWLGAEVIDTWSSAVPFTFDFNASFGLSSGGSGPSSFRWMDLFLPVAAGWLLWPLAPVYVLLMLAGCTGVAGYLFRPRRLSVQQQNRAFALSAYTAAPLALMILPLLTLGIVLHLLSFDPLSINNDLQAICQFLSSVAIVMVLGILFAWWMGTLKILRWSTQSTGGALLLAGLFLPIGWIIAAVLSLIVVPAVVGFFSLVIASLR